MKRTAGLAKLLALVLPLVFAGCATLPSTGGGTDAASRLAAALDGGSFPGSQLVVVVAEGKGISQALLYLVERNGGGWRPKGGALPAAVGRNGFAAPGEKREGDGRSPAGLFPLEFVFGYAPSVATAMPYRRCTEDDLWVDDPDSRDYNAWVKRGETGASSYERMLLRDRCYRYGVVIGYNRHPVVRGAGSAIFLHVLGEEVNATAGCIAVEEAELVRIIGWLDPARRPMILMGDRGDLAGLPGLSALAVP